MREVRAKNKKNASAGSLPFDGFYQLLAIAAVSMAAAPYFYLFLVRQVPLPWLIALLSSAALLYAGYGLQALTGRFVGTSMRRERVRAYEDTVRRFQPAQACIPLMLEAVLSILALSLIKNGYRAYAMATPGVAYDPKSLLPYLAAAGICAALMLGTVLWFYPYHRIFSVQTILPWGISFLICYLLHFLFGGISGVFLAVCLLLFALLFLLLLNQDYVIRAMDRAGTGSVTGEILKFNTSLVGVLTALFLLLFGIASVLLGGLTVLGRMLLFAIRDAGTSSGDEYRNWEEKLDSFVGMTFGDTEGSAFMLGQDAMKGALFLFLFFAVVALGLFLLFRFRRQAWHAFRAWIKRAVAELLHFFRTALDLWNGALIEKPEKKTADDYVDVRVQMEEQSDRPIPQSVPRNYRSVLASLDTSEEKVRYLYRLLLVRWGGYLTIHPSDTPQEIYAKVSARLSGRYLHQITDLFERFRYADRSAIPDDAEAEAGIMQMCEMLDAYERGDVS